VAAQPKSQNKTTMNHTPIYISYDDYTKLRLLLTTALYSGASDALRKLGDELDRAAVVHSSALPSNVVTLDSTVKFEDLATGEIEEYTITFPDRSDVEARRISVLSPIGTALLGCRVGDIVKWSTPGGIRQLKVRGVTSPVASNETVAESSALFAAAASS
jgi:regulator of nucleoside diphosphate kinase